MNRFWQEAWAERSVDGFAVLLDGKPVRVPGGGILLLNTEPLAQAVAAEWQKAGGGKAVRFLDLPLTRLAATAQERIAPNPEPVIAELLRYGQTDLLCYRAPAPEALRRRQHALWQPWIEWAALTLAAKLNVTTGIMPLTQDASALAALGRAVAAQNAPALAALGVVVPALGSLVLGLALVFGVLDRAQALEAAFLDERYQASLWGEDAEATQREQTLAKEVALAMRFLGLSA